MRKYSLLIALIVIASVFTGYLLYNNFNTKQRENQESRNQKTATNDNSTSQNNTTDENKSSNNGNNNGDKQDQNPIVDNHNIDLINQIVSLAKEGKVINCDFVTGKTTIDDIEKIYGNPDKQEYISSAKGTYTTFTSKELVFGFNKGMQVFETRSFDPRLQAISRSDIEDVLGKAPYKATISGTPSQTVLGYTMNSDYKLEFVISDTTNLVDHVNVLYPTATVNSMADDPGRQW
ncbi:YjgB family protein [Thermoanaerobacterium saccharolyticum]|uniref:YjgB family protein n=1 Tax=Thermoanaerobacterium saccharolyticum TaxID=28896 RepID=UPI002FD977ED